MTLLLLLGVAGVYSQPDQMACDNDGAYNTTTGTASCNGIAVDFFSLVCGNGFVPQTCVAKWTNSNGDEENYFFMGAGKGMSDQDLPSSCAGIGDRTPLAMVQYYPVQGSCYPAADLPGTQASYTASADGKSLASVTLTFAEHDDGSSVRDGYIKITCGPLGKFTTNGDTDVSSKYEVSVTAPCSPAPPPTPPTPPSPPPPHHPSYRCIDNTCVHSADGNGTPHDDCVHFCGGDSYRCEQDRCVAAVNGSSMQECARVCGPQPSKDVIEK